MKRYFLLFSKLLKFFIQILNPNLYPFMNPFISPTFSNINVGNTILYGKEDIRTNKEAIEQTEIFKISWEFISDRSFEEM